VPLAISIVVALAATVGVLWRALAKERRRHTLRESELQQQLSDKQDQLHTARIRDLQRFAGLPTSFGPPPDEPPPAPPPMNKRARAALAQTQKFGKKRS
jgi:C4-dicarboxylate-specific signal transduction histidine kinase